MDNMNDKKNIEALKPIEAWKMAFNKISEFKGRSRRSEYWWTFLLAYTISLVLPGLGIIAQIGMIPLTFRRLHDTGRSGWWFGIYLILLFIIVVLIGVEIVNIFISAMSNESENMLMLVGLIFAKFGIFIIIGAIYKIALIIFLCLDSDPGENKYGVSPKYQEEAEDMNQ